MKKWIVIGIVIIALIGSIVVGVYFKRNQSTTGTQTAAEAKNSNVVEYNGLEGKSALELLQNAAVVKYSSSEFGAFVSEINGIVNTDSEYWLYSVNGEDAAVAADKYITKDGDKVKWEFKGM